MLYVTFFVREGILIKSLSVMKVNECIFISFITFTVCSGSNEGPQQIHFHRSELWWWRFVQCCWQKIRDEQMVNWIRINRTTKREMFLIITNVSYLWTLKENIWPEHLLQLQITTFMICNLQVAIWEFWKCFIVMF